jgi:hypothetical protein
MKLVCKYCGFTVDYENGRGWFPGYAQKVTKHILEEHVKIDQSIMADTILYGVRIDPGYSDMVPWPLGSVTNATLTVTKEDRLSPPPYVEPTEPTIKCDS